VRPFGAYQRAGEGLEIELAGEVGVAGEPLRGVVFGATDPTPVTVTLLRVESSPSGTFTFSVCATTAEPEGDRSPFELVLPDDVPSPWDADRCRLEYVVRAANAGRRRARQDVTASIEIRGGEHPIHEDPGHLDRMIASYPARRFHLELVDAVLRGGGYVDGRVHTDEALRRGTIELVACCEEAWRTNLRFRNRRHPPLWQTRSLWKQATTIELGPDRRWYQFRFDIPADMPPGVEGRAIAWRYQIDARRPSRLAVAEHAVISPLRFEV
jgi:hypothetical protein